MIPIRITAIACAVSFVAGAVIGGEGVRRWVRHDHLVSQLDAKKKELRSYREALGFSADLEDETIKMELTHEDLVQAIIRQARVHGGDRRVCVSSDSMCAIGRIKPHTAASPGERQECGESDKLALVEEAETTELVARLRQSEAKNAQAVRDCQAFYRKLQRLYSGK